MLRASSLSSASLSPCFPPSFPSLPCLLCVSFLRGASLRGGPGKGGGGPTSDKTLEKVEREERTRIRSASERGRASPTSFHRLRRRFGQQVDDYIALHLPNLQSFSCAQLVAEEWLVFEALSRASQEAIKEGLRGPNLGWIAYGVGGSSGKSSDSILPSQRDLQVIAATSLSPRKRSRKCRPPWLRRARLRRQSRLLVND